MITVKKPIISTNVIVLLFYVTIIGIQKSKYVFI